MEPDLLQSIPSKALRKRLHSLGHHAVQWAQVLALLQRQTTDGRLPEALAREIENHFIGLDRIAPTAPTPDPLTLCVRLFHPPRTDFRVLDDMTQIVTHPASRALLHLPGLQTWWPRHLRASVLADLRRHWPRAWFVDLTPLPPFRTLHGLGLARWADLPQLAHSGWSLAWHVDAGQNGHLSPDSPSEDWHTATQVLLSARPGSAWISELPPPGTDVTLHYTCDHSRWDLTQLEPQPAPHWSGEKSVGRRNTL